MGTKLFRKSQRSRLAGLALTLGTLALTVGCSSTNPQGEDQVDVPPLQSDLGADAASSPAQSPDGKSMALVVTSTTEESEQPSEAGMPSSDLGLPESAPQAPSTVADSSLFPPSSEPSTSAFLDPIPEESSRHKHTKKHKAHAKKSESVAAKPKAKANAHAVARTKLAKARPLPMKDAASSALNQAPPLPPPSADLVAPPAPNEPSAPPVPPPQDNPQALAETHNNPDPMNAPPPPPPPPPPAQEIAATNPPEPPPAKSAETDPSIPDGASEDSSNSLLFIVGTGVLAAALVFGALSYRKRMKAQAEREQMQDITFSGIDTGNSTPPSQKDSAS